MLSTTLQDCKLILGLYFFSLYPGYECYFTSNDYEECQALAPRLQGVLYRMCMSYMLPVTLSLF